MYRLLLSTHTTSEQELWEAGCFPNSPVSTSKYVSFPCVYLYTPGQYSVCLCQLPPPVQRSFLFPKLSLRNAFGVSSHSPSQPLIFQTLPARLISFPLLQSFSLLAPELPFLTYCWLKLHEAGLTAWHLHLTPQRSELHLPSTNASHQQGAVHQLLYLTCFVLYHLLTCSWWSPHWSSSIRCLSSKRGSLTLTPRPCAFQQVRSALLWFHLGVLALGWGFAWGFFSPLWLFFLGSSFFGWLFFLVGWVWGFFVDFFFRCTKQEV